MRTGINPGKIDFTLEAFRRHRVVMPVHIPSAEGYFQHAMEILKLSLDSLILTTRGRVGITVISNGSTADEMALLRSYFDDGSIDQLIVNDRTWGKINTVVAATHARFEELVTVTDADVLFLPGWLDEVEATFHHFPEAGFVTPVPNPSLSFAHTSSTILSALLNRELTFERVVPEGDLDHFARSIGRPGYFLARHRRAQMVVKRNGISACVGGGHFVFTLRREVIRYLPHLPAMTAMGAQMSSRIDEPPDEIGVWRLSTTRAFARHMGNVPEPWMYDELKRCRDTPWVETPELPLPTLKKSRLAILPIHWRNRLVRGIREVSGAVRWPRVWYQSEADVRPGNG